MPASAKRRQALRKALSASIPGAPFDAFNEMLEASQAPHLKSLPPSNAAWLAAVSYVRHTHTDYEELLTDGYDRDSARHFIVDQINDVLTRWRATRLVSDVDEFEGYKDQPL